MGQLDPTVYARYALLRLLQRVHRRDLVTRVKEHKLLLLWLPLLLRLLLPLIEGVGEAKSVRHARLNQRRSKQSTAAQVGRQLRLVVPHNCLYRGSLLNGHLPSHLLHF